MPATDQDADAVAATTFVRRVGAAYRRPSGVVAHLRPTADGLRQAVGGRPPALCGSRVVF